MTADPFDLCGEPLGHFKILDCVGAGGFGVLYEALNTRLQRPTALKVLHPPDTASSEALDRFIEEARVLASFDHPHIARIYSVGEQSGYHYIEMELVDGQSLARLMEEHPSGLPVQRALEIAEQTAEALVMAHDSARVLHRDLKPSNVLIDAQGDVKLVDFGLARPLSGRESPVPEGEQAYFLGTPHYAAPEQCAGQQVDARSDIYSFGALLYYALSGKLPIPCHSEEADEEYLRRVIREAPMPLEEVAPDVPSDVTHMVMRMLAKDPEDRYQSVRVVRYDLRAAQKDLPGSAQVVGKTTRRLPPEVTGEAKAGHGRGLWQWLRLGVLIAAVLAAFAWSVNRFLWDMALNVPSEYGTIQAALDSAHDGDTVRVEPGTYLENLVWTDKSIELIGAGSEVTVIDGSNEGRCLEVSGAGEEAVIEGVTFKNGDADSGGGLSIRKSSLTVRNCVFVKNVSSGNGGGIAIIGHPRLDKAEVHTRPALIDNRITNNRAQGGGGGVSITANCSGLLKGNVISKNEAGTKGGGILTANGAFPTIRQNQIRGNTAASGGGVNVRTGAYAQVIDNHIERNTTVEWGGGAISCDHNASPIIRGNVIDGNTAKTAGGAIECYTHSSPTIQNNDLTDNHAGKNGGAISCAASSSPYVEANWISMNTAELRGGGISCAQNSLPWIHKNEIVENRAGAHGGGIALTKGCDTRIMGNVIQDNLSETDGGGIACVDAVSPQILNNVIKGNFTRHLGGGGIWCNRDSEPVIERNKIVGNWAPWHGGGILCTRGASPLITRNTISYNLAPSGAGIKCRNRACPRIVDNTLERNEAFFLQESYMPPGANQSHVGGAGIACAYLSAPFVKNCRIIGNSGKRASALFCWDRSCPVVESCDISGNRSDVSGAVVVDQKLRRGRPLPEEFPGSLFLTGNRICANAGAGVVVRSGRRVCLRCNAIFDNAGHGIDLNADGVTENDGHDGDSGPNGLQNYPVLTSATNHGATLTVEGRLFSRPKCKFDVEIFCLHDTDPSGHREGREPLDITSVTTGPNGYAVFQARVRRGFTIPWFVTATATHPEHGTSEFSRPILVVPRTGQAGGG